MANRPWTVLVYIVADDDRQPGAGHPSLNKIAAAQIAELSKTAREMKGQPLVLTQVDFTNPRPKQCVFPDDSSADAARICTPIEKEPNSASRRTIGDFFKWAAGVLREKGIQNSRFAVIFWGHAAGPAGLFRDPAPASTNPSLKLPDLRRALQDGLQYLGARYFDVVMFQDCWTSSLEVVYELKDVARYMVASQEIIAPIEKIWPYTLLFEELLKPTSPSLEMLDAIVGRLADQYERKIAFSGLTLDAAPGLALPLARLTAALQSLTDDEREASRRMMREMAGGDPALIDVRAFCKRLRDADIVKQQALALERVANTLVRASTAQDGSGLRGVSLFHSPPDNERDKDEKKSVFADSVLMFDYNELQLSEDTEGAGANWSEVAFENRFVVV